MNRLKDYLSVTDLNALFNDATCHFSTLRRFLEAPTCRNQTSESKGVTSE